MPRKAKDEEKNIVDSKATPKKKNSTSSTKKSTASKKSVPKTTTAKKSTSSKKSSNVKKVNTTKSAAKKETVKIETTVAKRKPGRPKKQISENIIEPVAKKRPGRPKKQVIEDTKKTVTKKKTARPKKQVTSVIEYYDLPFRYNETVVKLLAQTPKKLFIYWDISDTDRQNLIANFGEDFFNNTRPVLIIHNESNNSSFEIEINDFANCWYLEVNDTSVKYKIELGRRSKKQDYYIPNDYIYLSSSNELENPNDHILFEKLSNTIYFRNVKTNTTYPKNIANLNFMKRIGKIYNIYDAYKKLYGKIYNDEDILNNPSSGNWSI